MRGISTALAVVITAIVVAAVVAGITYALVPKVSKTVTTTSLVTKYVTTTKTLSGGTVTTTTTVTKVVTKTVTASVPSTTSLPPLPSPEEVKGVIDFYTSIPKDMAIELIKMFNKKYPNVRVNLFRSGTAKVMAKLMAEVESGRIVADVIWVADPASIILLKQKGLLLKYVPPEAALIPYKDPDGYWIAGRVILQVIAYNTKMIKEPPTSWKDLISPTYIEKLPKEWRSTSWLAMPNPLYSGAVTATVYALSNKYGWDYFSKLRKLGVVVEKSNGAVLKGILMGKYPVGITLDYMVRGAEAKGEPIKMVIPKDGAILIPSPIAILKTTKYPEAAKVFVRFMLSKEVQEMLAKWGIIPARIDVSPPAGTPPLSQIPAITINWDKMASNLEKIRDKFQEVVLS